MSEAAQKSNPEVLATFEVELRPDANVEELMGLQADLFEVARKTPTIGEIGSQLWTREDGALMVIYTFKSMDAMKEFVRHPEHVAVMERGKEFFASVGTQIATMEKKNRVSYDS